MAKEVKPRKYDGSGRRAAAQQTRQLVLAAARQLFLTQGYEATSVAEIATLAGTSIDTVYASVGRKPQLLLAVHDMELARAAEPVTSTERDYVQRVRAAATARDKIRIYAESLAERLPQTVPLMEALHAAGTKDPECLAVYRSLSRRRAANMKLFAADLRATGEVRAELTDDELAVLVWSMNSPEYFRLLADAGYTPQAYAALLVDVWTRTIIAAPDRGQAR